MSTCSSTCGKGPSLRAFEKSSHLPKMDQKFFVSKASRKRSERRAKLALNAMAYGDCESALNALGPYGVGGLRGERLTVVV